MRRGKVIKEISRRDILLVAAKSSSSCFHTNRVTAAEMTFQFADDTDWTPIALILKLRSPTDSLRQWQAKSRANADSLRPAAAVQQTGKV